MAASHGSVAHLLVNSVDYSTYLKDASFDTNVEAAEVTGLGSISKSYIPGIEESTFKLGGHYDPTIASDFAALKRTITTFEYRPAGSGTGLPKYTGSCIITSMTVGTSVSGAATFDAAVQVTGNVTLGVQ